MLSPVANFIVNDIIQPILFKTGDVILPVDFLGFGKVEYDFDVSMTRPLLITNDSLEAYMNGGIYILTEDNYAKLPTRELQFIDNPDLGFQVSFSEFFLN